MERVSHTGAVRELMPCVRCEQPFEGTVTIVMGARLREQFCPSCLGEMDTTPAIDAATPDMHDLLEKAGVNVREHGTATLDGFDASDASVALKAAKDFLLDALHAGQYDPVRGLILCGPTGTGKTHLAVAIIREFLAFQKPGRRKSIVFIPAPRLITDIQDTYGTGKTGAILDRLEHADLLVLDDLGDEKATPDALRIIRGLIDARVGHPTVITSNLLPSELGARWGEDEGWVRLASRLATRNYRVVKVSGRDRRFRRREEGAA